MINKSNTYYKQFRYIIEKKLSVEDNYRLKDYAKQGCYLYIIFDVIDKNRFLYISTKHYEDKTEIPSDTFHLRKITGKKDSILLKKYVASFGVEYWDVVKQNPQVSIIMDEFLVQKTAEGKIKSRYKTHTKKIAIDYPDWYIDRLKSYNVKRYKKKFEKEVLRENNYNGELMEHFISTLFILKDRKFQRLNDHAIILDQGKTGKSSLIGYMGSKADNVSMAGLYGSSDSKAGKFKGGLITLTDKTILIDEINELVESKHKGEKILSILNTMLENGEYNYIKQFSAKITASNQFYLMGNISDEFNFPLFLEGAVGNTLTIGRRFGVITYSVNLEGFKKGLTRDPTPNKYMYAIQKYLSNLFNYILEDTPFLRKVTSHSKYKELEQFYKTQLNKINSMVENETTRSFINSHKESIDRQIIRALKLHIYENIDKYLNLESEIYTNHLPYQILCKTKVVLEQNLLNINNICEHINNSTITSKKEIYNKLNFETLPKSYQNTLKMLWANKIILNQKGVSYYDLQHNQEIKQMIFRMKTGVLGHKKINEMLLKFGCRIKVILNQDVIFAVVNSNLFESKMDGIFQELEKNVDLVDLDSDII